MGAKFPSRIFDRMIKGLIDVSKINSLFRYKTKEILTCEELNIEDVKRLLDVSYPDEKEQAVALIDFTIDRILTNGVAILKEYKLFAFIYEYEGRLEFGFSDSAPDSIVGEIRLSEEVMSPNLEIKSEHTELLIAD